MNRIYFIRSEHAGWIKIGYSDDAEKRFSEHQAETGDTLMLLGTMPGDVKLEAALHLTFRHLRIRREWFLPEPELLAYIERRTTGGDAAAAPEGANGFSREHDEQLIRRRGQPWEAWEDHLLLDDQLTARGIALRIGRTPHSIGERRRWLKKHRETLRRMMP